MLRDPLARLGGVRVRVRVRVRNRVTGLGLGLGLGLEIRVGAVGSGVITGIGP